MQNGKNPFRLLVGSGKNSDDFATLETAGINAIEKGDLVVVLENGTFVKTNAAAAALSQHTVFYIAQGTGVMEGNTGGQVIYKSSPLTKASIERAIVDDYAAEVEDVVSIDFGDISPAANVAMKFTLVLPQNKNMHDQRQTRREFFWLSTGTATTNVTTLRDLILADEFLKPLVTAAVDGTETDTLNITALAQPIDPRGVDLHQKVQLLGFLATEDESVNYSAAVTVTKGAYGKGTFKLMRDLEFFAQGEIGISNRTMFPADNPTKFVEADCNYNLLTITSRHANYRMIEGTHNTLNTTVIAVKDSPATAAGTEVAQGTATGDTFAHVMGGLLGITGLELL